jgi:hypothetical protein
MLKLIKKKIKDEVKVSDEIKNSWDNFDEELFKEFVAQKKLYLMSKQN